MVAVSSTWPPHLLLLLLCWRGIETTENPGPTPPPLVSGTGLLTEVKKVDLIGESHVEKVELFKPVSLELECTWKANRNKLTNVTGHWRKNGEEIENSRLPVMLENEQYNLKRVFTIADEESLGNYSCVFGESSTVDFHLAVPQMGEARDKPIVSYVGDSVFLTCKMEDPKPKPKTWQWYRRNTTDLVLIDAAKEPARYKLTNVNYKTTLTVFNLTKADSGTYRCGAVYDVGTSTSHLEVKVISILEPLKPFAVIVAKVLILVTLILVYEKNTSQSSAAAENGRNTDQTSKITQGENEMEGNSTSIRQRKT